MLAPRLGELRRRLDGLVSGTPELPGLLARTWVFFTRAEDLKPLQSVVALDRALNQVGIHTAPDARLLKLAARGKAGELAKGLQQRAEEALDEFSDRLRNAELALASGVPLSGAEIGRAH